VKSEFERIWKEGIIGHFREFPNFCIRNEETLKIPGYVSHCSDCSLSPGPLMYETNVLHTVQAEI